MQKLLLIIIISIAAPACVCAQQASLYFTRITTQNGLSNNKVNCIIKDQRGFIWVGTDDGLNRYDGNKFTIFRNEPGVKSSISGNIITDMLEDKKGLLWITTADGGLTRYDYRQPPRNQFKQYRHSPGDPSSIPVNIINKILQDDQDYLWLCTSGSFVLRFDKQTEQFTIPVPKGTNTAFALTTDASGTIWVGRQGGGLLKINPRNFNYESDPRYNDLYAKLPHTTVTSLFTDRDKNIWYGSWDRILYRYDAILKKEIAISEKEITDDVLTFAQDKDGNLWIGGRYNGLHIYNKAQQKFYHYSYDPSKEGTIAGNRIGCIYIDASGTIWIGTNRGLSISNPLQQQFKQTFLPNVTDKTITIEDFYKDEKDNLWLATTEGIFIRRAGSVDFEHRPLKYKGTPLRVSLFFKDAKGNHYIGTNYTLFLFNPSVFSITALPNTEKDDVMKQIINSRVISISEDSIDGHPVLLVSPFGHFLTYYDFTEKRWVSRRDSVKKIIQQFNIKDNLIRKIYKTNAGSIFMATAKEGLAEWVANPAPRLQYYKNSPQQPGSLSNNNVFDMVEDSKGNLWVSTFGGGLHYFNTVSKKAAHIKASSNLLEGVETDNAGNVWMVSNGDLHKYNTRTKTYSTFKLPDVEKFGGIQGRICKDEDGNLYVAGTNYFIEFNPLQIQENKNEPKPFFTDFKIFNQSYSDLLLQKKILLRHNQNFVSFEFAAPDYSSGNPVHYQYMLQGFDNKWVDNGAETRASFSNLDGGDYIFKVRATGKPGIWNDQFAAIKLTIIPPVWKRWWFYALCALFVAGVAYIVYRYRINELIKRQEIRNKIAQDLHDNVGSTLSSISIYSQVAKIYKAQDKEKQLQETLEKISETSGEMISEMNDIVWAINPRNDNMDVIVQRMESYAKPLLSAKEIKFSFAYDASVQSLNLDMTKRKNFYLIFKESINNILKYASCKNVQVIVTSQNHQLKMSIHDDGQGFDVENMKILAAKSLSGNGLNNMKRRAAEMKGECFIESKPGMGTTVRLRLPIP